MINKLIRKFSQYIRTKFSRVPKSVIGWDLSKIMHRKPFDVDIDTVCAEFPVDLVIAAKCMSDTIDKDILDSLYRQVVADIDKEIMKNTCFGHMPKIFVRPSTAESEIIELESGVKVVRVKHRVIIRGD